MLSFLIVYIFYKLFEDSLAIELSLKRMPEDWGFFFFFLAYYLEQRITVTLFHYSSVLFTMIQFDRYSSSSLTLSSLPSDFPPNYPSSIVP